MYDASVDIGVAVKEDPITTNSKRKKKRRKRKRSASVASEGNVEKGDASSALGTVISKGLDGRVELVNEGGVEKKRRANKKTPVVTLEDQAVDTKPRQTEKKIAISMPLLKGNYTKERSNLPVYQHRNELCTLVAENDVVLVVAETVSSMLYHYLCSAFCL